MPADQFISRTFCASVNHLLGRQAWARNRLAAHADRQLRIEAPPWFPILNLSITAEGLTRATAGDKEPALQMRVNPEAIPFLLTRKPDALKHIELAGNADLAAAVQALVLGLEWDIEEDLAGIVGDIAAHRMAKAVRELLAWQSGAMQRTAQNLAEYWTEENPMLAQRIGCQRLQRDIEALELDLERLHSRIGALARRVP